MRKKLDLTIAGHDVVLSRRKGTRSLKISIKSDNSILLSAPYIISERQAVAFLQSKQDWIKQHAHQFARFEHNSLIGKGGRVLVDTKDGASSIRLHDYNVIVKVPSEEAIDSSDIQKKITEVADKSLKKQAEILLPQRIEQLSQRIGISYKTCSVRKLKSRWGSCDTHNDITLNMYLVQLDWKLIDYVIIHELVHTIHKHHQATFWTEVQKHLPDYKERRKKLKEHKTIAFAQ